MWMLIVFSLMYSCVDVKKYISYTKKICVNQPPHSALIIAQMIILQGLLDEFWVSWTQHPTSGKTM